MITIDALLITLNTRIQPVHVYFRDDDGGWDNDQLRALLAVFARYECPLDVAVIPTQITPVLIDVLSTHARLGVHQHGFQHQNHERTGRKCEFGPGRDRAAQHTDLVRGQCMMLEAFGVRTDPIFTPPWNRCTADTIACLRALGFAAVSRDIKAEGLDHSSLVSLPVCIDWQKKGDLNTRLASAFGTLDRVGIMLHHAVMDDASRHALGQMLHGLSQHPMLSFQCMADLIPSDKYREQAACA